MYFNRDEICDADDNPSTMRFIKTLDIGDIIGIEGKLFTTKVGETIMVKDFTILSKSSAIALPKEDNDGNIYDEFNDPELRYRQICVDLIVNPNVRKRC